MNTDALNQALTAIRNANPSSKPECGLILGSGWGSVVDAFHVRSATAYASIPGLGAPTVADHAGRLLNAELQGVETLIFHGRRHWYEGEGWEPVAIPVFTLKQMGASIVILTNAAGSLRPDLNPGDFMIIDDHINGMHSHPLIGPHHPCFGPRFPDLSETYDSRLRAVADRVASQMNRRRFAHGVYLAVSGPTYETPAEVRAFRQWGADAVGMSTVPEAILARAAGLRVLGISLITNAAAGLSTQTLNHEDVIRTAQEAVPDMKQFITRLWKELAMLQKGTP